MMWVALDFQEGYDLLLYPLKGFMLLYIRGESAPQTLEAFALLDKHLIARDSENIYTAALNASARQILSRLKSKLGILINKSIDDATFSDVQFVTILDDDAAEAEFEAPVLELDSRARALYKRRRLYV